MGFSRKNLTALVPFKPKTDLSCGLPRQVRHGDESVVKCAQFAVHNGVIDVELRQNVEAMSAVGNGNRDRDAKAGLTSDRVASIARVTASPARRRSSSSTTAQNALPAVAPSVNARMLARSAISDCFDFCRTIVDETALPQKEF